MRDAILHLPRLVFGAAPVGDVVQRADLAQRSAVRRARRLRQVMHVAQRAVGMNHAILDVHLSSARVQLVARLLPARAVRRVDHRFQIFVHRDVRLAVAAAEHAVQMRRPIVLVFAVEVHDVVAEVGDLLRDRQLRLAPAQRLLRVAAHRDVADEADEARRIGALHAADRQLRRELAAVAALGDQLATDADDARLAGLDVVPQVIFVLRAVRLGQQDVHLQPDDFLLVVAEHALAGVIQQLDATLVIEQHDRVHCRIEYRLELPFQPVRPLLLKLRDSQ